MRPGPQRLNTHAPLLGGKQNPDASVAWPVHPKALLGARTGEEVNAYHGPIAALSPWRSPGAQPARSRHLNGAFGLGDEGQPADLVPCQ